MQGQDGVDLEMNINGSRSRRDDDEFDDLVGCCYPFDFLPFSV